MSLRKLLTPKDKLFTLPQSKTVSDAVVKMDEMNIGATLVADDDGVIFGIFSERDLLRRVVAKNLNPNELQLKDVMSDSLITIDVGHSPSAALELMQEKKIRHLPVTSTGSNVEDEEEDRLEEEEIMRKLK